MSGVLLVGVNASSGTELDGGPAAGTAVGIPGDAGGIEESKVDVDLSTGASGSGTNGGRNKRKNKITATVFDDRITFIANNKSKRVYTKTTGSACGLYPICLTIIKYNDFIGSVKVISPDWHYNCD